MAATTSDVSQNGSESASVRKTCTMVTTLDDVLSVTSSRILPAGPHPTPAQTIAGDIPNNDFITEKLQGLELTASNIALSESVTGPKRVESNHSDLSAEFPEASKWDGVAEEDVIQGLQRLAVVAEDENKEDPSKSVEHYYSMRLAKIIANGKVKFNAAYLV